MKELPKRKPVLTVYISAFGICATQNDFFYIGFFFFSLGVVAFFFIDICADDFNGWRDQFEWDEKQWPLCLWKSRMIEYIYILSDSYPFHPSSSPLVLSGSNHFINTRDWYSLKLNGSVPIRKPDLPFIIIHVSYWFIMLSFFFAGSITLLIDILASLKAAYTHAHYHTVANHILRAVAWYRIRNACNLYHSYSVTVFHFHVKWFCLMLAEEKTKRH